MAPRTAVLRGGAPSTLRLVCVTLCLVVGVTLSSARAQTVTATTGAVNGIVTDSTEAVVPGVTVSLSGPALMTARTAITDQAGAYRFSAVPPGDHTLTFELAGFGTVVRDDVHVGLGFTATVNVEMQPGTLHRPRRRSAARRRSSTSPPPQSPRISTAEKLRQPARARATSLRAGEHARGRDVEDGRRRQRRARAAGVHRLRPAGDHRHEPQRGRRHSGRRGQRRERQLPVRFRVVRGDCDQGGRATRRRCRSRAR